MKLVLLFTILAAATMADDWETEQKLQNGNDQFTARMFSEVVTQNPDKSVVMSGFSVMTPLAQLALAAEGASHDELLRAIGMPNDNATKEVFQLINRKLRSVKGVDLRMASRVYIAEGYALDENYQRVSRDIFGSEAKNVDFSNSRETARKINTWVEDHTNHRIKDVVSPNSLNSDTRVVLVNAIYFKGEWEKPFDKKRTSDRDFYISKGKTIKVPTMHKKEKYEYAESAELNAKLLTLPYKGYEASMLIILPNEIDGLPALEDKLQNPDLLTAAMKNMIDYNVDVYLPRFKIETTIDLKEVLKNIDVTKIFDAREAQLNHMLKGEEADLYVSEATQKAFIEVNEKGAEAAAANAFVSLKIAARKPSLPEAEFIADHPFVFLLSDGTNTLFSGAYLK